MKENTLVAEYLDAWLSQMDEKTRVAIATEMYDYYEGIATGRRSIVTHFVRGVKGDECFDTGHESLDKMAVTIADAAEKRLGYKLTPKQREQIQMQCYSIFMPYANGVSLKLHVNLESGAVSLDPFDKAAAKQMQITITKKMNKNGIYDTYYTFSDSGKNFTYVLDSKGHVIGRDGAGQSSKAYENYAKYLYSRGFNSEYMHKAVGTGRESIDEVKIMTNPAVRSALVIDVLNKHKNNKR